MSCEYVGGLGWTEPSPTFINGSAGDLPVVGVGTNSGLIFECGIDEVVSEPLRSVLRI